MSEGRTLLLLDLDGVVVFEAEPPRLAAVEILLLHDLLGDLLKQASAPVVVVTHRSKAEARRILEAAGLNSGVLSGIMAAEDLFWAGLRHQGPFRLARKGLRKSLILPVVEKQFGVPRDRMALIDDRLDNLEDMLEHGLGLALLAPSLMEESGHSITSFDVNEALDAFRSWGGNGRREIIVRLTAREFAVDPWRKTGLNTQRQGRHLFNLTRRVGQAARRRLFEKRA
jgi:hypothetical protein